eukprot:TRINITY_DN33928_c0_g1_i2.p1 TRINITY_DN33928_c0_g1~~TRINITY_DN33928_c0_g1_i2.p1  ORF type:complete len:114 (-),score=3.97 TRINITY_DN33928_c0_g1_i2:120-461(-)
MRMRIAGARYALDHRSKRGTTVWLWEVCCVCSAACASTSSAREAMRRAWSEPGPRTSCKWPPDLTALKLVCNSNDTRSELACRSPARDEVSCEYTPIASSLVALFDLTNETKV